MIDPATKDINRKVYYRSGGKPPEVGTVTDFNPMYVFVQFAEDRFSKACRREDLAWVPEGTDLSKPPPEPPKEDKFLVWSEEHGMWWKASGWGYTHSIVEAGRFTEARAAEIVKQANFAPHIFNEVAVPVPPGVPVREPS